MKNKFLNYIEKAQKYFLSICLATMCVVMLMHVVLRYFFNMPLIWSEELLRYLLIWITFISIGYGINNKSHIGIELFYNKMPFVIQKLISIFSNLLIILCFIYCMPGANRFIAFQDGMVSSAMQINMAIVYFVIPLGFVLGVLYLLINIIKDIKQIICYTKEDVVK